MKTTSKIFSNNRWSATWLLILSLPVSASLLDDAQTAWQNRAQEGQTEQAIALWKESLKAADTPPEVYIYLTRACGRAYRHATTRKEQLKWINDGRHFGEEAVKKNPSSAAAFTEHAAMLGQSAQARQGIKSLSLVKKAVKALKQAIQLDPQYAFAHALLSEFYRQSPVLISVGDKKKALYHAEQAVEIDGNTVLYRLILAKNYLDHGANEKAIQQLEQALMLPPPADRIPETESDKQGARELLEKLKSK